MISPGIFSLLLHAAIFLAMLLAAAVVATPPQLPLREIKMPLTIRIPAPRKSPEASGGGQSSPEPSRKGQPPPAKTRRVFLPPMVARNDVPKLPLESTMIDAPELELTAGDIGDPFSLNALGGGGPGPGRGIGPGPGNGIGDGGKPGIGGKILASLKKLTRRPQLVHQEEPEYSEEARRAHAQGFVRLSIDVGLDGLPKNIRVVQSMGMGLDENAIEAVKRWRFKPALMGDQPVEATALIEVGFHLI